MTGAAIPLAAISGRHVDIGSPVKSIRGPLFLLAAVVALVGTGYGIVLPVLARRLGELGYGVGELSILTGAFALSQFIVAPVAGSLADRIGRRPVMMIALVGYLLGNIGYLVATDFASLLAARLVQGALTAGLFPAAMALVGDIVPERWRGRWIGVLLASFGASFVAGPVLGGVLYDMAGYAAPFEASVALAAVGLLIALPMMRETLTPVLRRRRRLLTQHEAQGRRRVGDVFPRPRLTFAILLLAVFAQPFALTYAEPQVMFYVYDRLGWSTIQLGLVLGTYGLAMMLTQLTLGGISDGRFGRRWIVAVGLVAISSVYACLAFAASFPLILAFSAVSGVGMGLITPAIGASLLDLAPPIHRARIMGFRSAATSLGAILGPAAALLVSGWLPPTTAFATAAAFVLAIAATTALTLPKRIAPKLETDADTYRLKLMTAGATLRGLVVSSSDARLS